MSPRFQGGFRGGHMHTPDGRSTHPLKTYLRLLRYSRPYLHWVFLVVCLSMFTAFVGVLPQQVIGVAVDELAAVTRQGGADEGRAEEERPALRESAGTGDRIARPRGSQIMLAPYVKRLSKHVATNWFPEHNAGYVMFYILGAGFMLLYLVSSSISIVQGLCMSYLGQSLIYDMRNQVYGHVQKLSLSYFEDQQTGDVMSRVVNDVNSLEQVIVGPVVGFLTDVARLSFLLYFCLRWDWLLTVLGLLVTPVMVGTTYVFGKFLRKNFTILRKKVGELNALLQDNISGIRVIKGFAREEHEFGRFLTKNRENFQIHFRLAKLFTVFRPVIGLLDQLGTVIVLCVGGIRVLNGDMQIGVFTVFFVYLRMIYSPITGMSRFYNHIQRALASSERVFDLLDTRPGIEEKHDAVVLGRVRGEVAFRDVCFAYGNGVPVLDAISLDVQPGQMIAFVGPSGAGKTTLTNLILRFYDPTGGAITIDGHDLRDLSLKSLRSQMGIVQQDPFLFNDTVKTNIAYGRLNATDDEIVAAAEAANAHQFITEFPDGYDSTIGERGVKLSGGQRQRLSIARAILADPRILILDEATSSVDTETEVLIQNAIDNLVKNRTTFVVAHRLSTIQHADLIIVLEHGHVVESGKHDELLANNGLYRRLYDVQFNPDRGRGDESEDTDASPGRGARNGMADAGENGFDLLGDMSGTSLLGG